MTKSIRVAAAVVLAVSISGCAPLKETALVPTGGSRIEGTVRMSYEVGMFQGPPRINQAKTLANAGARCKAWGYDRAEAFGGQTRTCYSTSMFGECVHWLVTIEYQCTTDTPLVAAPDPLNVPAPAAQQTTNAPRE